MEKIQQLTLIDGTFAPTEARKLLSDIISRKINYHQLEMFSNEERFGKDISNSKKRIEALRATNEQLKMIIDDAIEKQYRLQVTSFIDIKYVEDKAEEAP